MNELKKSFLVYFDNYPMVLALPPEQRGWLLTALMVYGMQAGQEGEQTVEEVMDRFPAMTPDTRVACGFMGASIRRDTQRWLARKQRASERRQRTKAPERAAPDQQAIEDMARMRRLLESQRI